VSAVTHSPIYIGCAGWSIHKDYVTAFPAGGSHLQRYAARLPAVEINSSFYRSHRPATYARWAASVPAAFRFAVKMPREITHHRRLNDVTELLDRFLDEAGALGDKMGPLLAQLPPRFAFAAAKAETFFEALRKRFVGQVVCEPRHATWFSPAAGELLATFQVARAGADPAINPTAAEPGAWTGITYYRLHGSPEMYNSPYPPEFLGTLAGRLVQNSRSAPVWCIFDNTALGYAMANTLDLLQRVERTQS
jgi:uncharacterized protein YecE (DUF72 family)